MNENIALNEDDIEYVRTLSENAYDLKSKMEIFAQQLRERHNKIEETEDITEDIDELVDLIWLMDEVSEMVEDAYDELDSYLEEHD